MKRDARELRGLGQPYSLRLAGLSLFGLVLLFVVEAWADPEFQVPPTNAALSGQFQIRPPDASLARPLLNPSSVPVSARSLSGQFIIRDERFPGASRGLIATNRDLVRLESTFLAISCERIRQELIRETGGSPLWRGKIFLALHSASNVGELTAITSEHFRDGWHYRVDLADQLERTRFVRAMVQVLLLETANRNAGEHSAEIPAWLLEGLTQQVLASSDIELVIPPPVAMGNGVSFAATDVLWRRENPLEQAHKDLLQGPLLSFEQLSWPTDEQLSDALYQGCAQLFVSRLLQLNDGKACLQDMLAQLPSYYNWQFAFLRGFHNHFQKALDVEKWWALSAVHFTGRELAQTWPMEESWKKLDALVHEGIQIRSTTNEVALHSQVSLQRIILDWERIKRTQVLSSKLRELDMLRMRVADGLVPIVDGYRQVLENFLQHTRKGGFQLPVFKKIALNHAISEAVQRLDELDSQRSELKPDKAPAARAQASSNR